MPPPRRDRDRRPGRRPPFRDPKPLILIVCEGQNTEPQYFRGLSNDCRNPRVRIEVAREHGVPKTLVEAAKQHKQRSRAEASRENDSNLLYDSIWCVFDVDEHPHIPDAEQMARDNGIELAISNPCFELWLLLHFRDQPGMHHRDVIRQLLKKHDPAYDKSVDFRIYSAHHRDATSRAERIHESAKWDGEPGRNPSTTVYQVAKLITDETTPGAT